MVSNVPDGINPLKVFQLADPSVNKSQWKFNEKEGRWEQVRIKVNDSGQLVSQIVTQGRFFHWLNLNFGISVKSTSSMLFSKDQIRNFENNTIKKIKDDNATNITELFSSVLGAAEFASKLITRAEAACGKYESLETKLKSDNIHVGLSQLIADVTVKLQSLKNAQQELKYNEALKDLEASLKKAESDYATIKASLPAINDLRARANEQLNVLKHAMREEISPNSDLYGDALILEKTMRRIQWSISNTHVGPDSETRIAKINEKLSEAASQVETLKSNNLLFSALDDLPLPTAMMVRTAETKLPDEPFPAEPQAPPSIPVIPIEEPTQVKLQPAQLPSDHVSAPPPNSSDLRKQTSLSSLVKERAAFLEKIFGATHGTNISESASFQAGAVGYVRAKAMSLLAEKIVKEGATPSELEANEQIFRHCQEVDKVLGEIIFEHEMNEPLQFSVVREGLDQYLEDAIDRMQSAYNNVRRASGVANSRNDIWSYTLPELIVESEKLKAEHGAKWTVEQHAAFDEFMVIKDAVATIVEAHRLIEEQFAISYFSLRDTDFGATSVDLAYVKTPHIRKLLKGIYTPFVSNLAPISSSAVENNPLETFSLRDIKLRGEQWMKAYEEAAKGWMAVKRMIPILEQFDGALMEAENFLAANQPTVYLNRKLLEDMQNKIRQSVEAGEIKTIDDMKAFSNGIHLMLEAVRERMSAVKDFVDKRQAIYNEIDQFVRIIQQDKAELEKLEREEKIGENHSGWLRMKYDKLIDQLTAYKESYQTGFLGRTKRVVNELAMKDLEDYRKAVEQAIEKGNQTAIQMRGIIVSDFARITEETNTIEKRINEEREKLVAFRDEMKGELAILKPVGPIQIVVDELALFEGIESSIQSLAMPANNSPLMRSEDLETFIKEAKRAKYRLLSKMAALATVSVKFDTVQRRFEESRTELSRVIVELGRYANTAEVVKDLQRVLDESLSAKKQFLQEHENKLDGVRQVKDFTKLCGSLIGKMEGTLKKHYRQLINAA